MADLHSSEGIELNFVVKSDVGLVRDNNEDSFISAILPDEGLLIVVADGMGGHDSGEVASGLAVRVIEEEVLNRNEDAPQQRLYDALIEANRVICAEAEAESSGARGMGTTAIATIIKGDQVFVGQVGDSRCYLLRAGMVAFKSQDHTRVQELVDAGEIEEHEARLHPESGMLTRALGHSKMSNGDPLVPEVRAEPLTLALGDCLLLCSDGLTDLADDEEIAKMVCGKGPDSIVDSFIELAHSRGAHDNITVAVLTVGEEAACFDPVAVDPVDVLSSDDTFDYDEDDGEEDTEDVLLSAVPISGMSGISEAHTDAIAVEPIVVTPPVAEVSFDQAEEVAGGSGKKKLIIVATVIGLIVVVLGLVLLGILLYLYI